MRFEAALEKARNGGKVRRPGMGEGYITFSKVSVSKDEDDLRPVFVTISKAFAEFNITSRDIAAEDWVDADPIVKVKMFSESFYVRCPNCNRRYSTGNVWQEKVGDIYKCSCGNRLLLEPPEGTGCTTDTRSKDSWPAI